MTNSTASLSTKQLGVLGGMGPDATLYFSKLVLQHTPHACDQDHIRQKILLATQTPDRTQSILSNSHTHIQQSLRASVIELCRMDIDVIVAPCNTVHYYADTIQAAAAKTPFLNMINITCDYLSSQQVKCVGILGTTGTIHCRLYQDALEQRNIHCIHPSADQQQQVMEIITAIKSGDRSDTLSLQLLDQVNSLQSEGTERILLGCTELPLIAPDTSVLVDPMYLLAKASITFCCSKDPFKTITEDPKDIK